MRPFVVLLISLIISSGIRATAQTSEAPEDSLRILTWNIFMISPIAPRQSLRANAIAQVLSKGEYDIVVLQEAFKQNRVKQMKEILDTVYPHQIIPKKKNGIYSSGVWILSKLPFIESQSVLYNERKHFDRFADKGAERVRVKKGDLTLDVIGTHTQAMEKPKHYDVRESQFGQIKNCLYREDSVPTLIIGDLNTPLKPTDRYWNMLHILDAKEGPVFVPSQLNVIDTVCYTWGCVYNDLTPENYKGQTGLYDYALMREKGRKLQVQRTLRVDKGFNDKGEFNLSDHYAIDVMIKF